jgi:hypothetical protein
MRWFFDCGHTRITQSSLEPRVQRSQSATVGEGHQESTMSSTHEPPQLLEPSNLLEPLDLKHQHADFADRSARGESEGSGARAPRRFTRETPCVPRTSEAERRSPVKSILLAAGALACFGAGTLFSQMQILTPSDVGSSPTIASANRAPAPLADVATKSDESTSTDGKSADSSSNESKPNTASNAAATPPTATSPAEQKGSATAQGAQAVPAAQPAANDAVAGCAGSCKQQPCPPDDVNCLEGGAPSPAKNLTNADGSAATPAKAARPARQAASAQSADSERADTAASSRADSERADIRASSREEERTQSSGRSKRAAQREVVEQPSGSKRKVATGGGAGRRQDGNRASGSRRDFASDDGMPSANSSGRWQSRDAEQASNGWWDWSADDNVPAGRSSGRAENVDQAVNWRRDRAGEGRRQEREPDRASNWRRDRAAEDRWQERDWDRASSRRRERSDDYGRDDDRRSRAGRDDFLMGRAERNEGPLMMMGPPTRYRW